MNEADIVAAKIEAKRKKLEEAAARRRTSSSDTTSSAESSGSTDTTGEGGGDAATAPAPAPATPASTPPPAQPEPLTTDPARPPKTHVELSAPAGVTPAGPAAATPGARPPSARTAPAPAPTPPAPLMPAPPPAAPLPPWLMGVVALVVVVVVLLVIALRPAAPPAEPDPTAPGTPTQPGEATERPPAPPVVAPATESTPPEAPPTAPPATSAETPPETPPTTPPETPTAEPPPTIPPPTPPPARPVTKVDALHVAPVVSATPALGRVDVSWTPSSESHHVLVRAYEVLRRPVSGGEWTKIGESAGDARAHADAAAPVGTGSVYKVVSVAVPTSDATLPEGAERVESAVSPPAMPIREFVVIPVSVTVPTDEELDRNPQDKGVASVTVYRWDPETSSYQRHIFRPRVGMPVGAPDKLRGGRAFDFSTNATLDEVRVETRKHPTLGHDRQVQVIRLLFADGTTQEFDDTMEPPK